MNAASWRRAEKSSHAGLSVAAGVMALAAGFAVAHHPVGLLAVGLAAFAAIALVRPDAVTVLVVFLVVTNTPAVLVAQGVPQAAAAIVPLLLVIPLVAYLLRGDRLVASPLLLLIGLYFVIEIAAASRAADFGTASVRLQTFMLEGLLSFFLLTNVIRTTETVRRVVWAIVAGGAFLGLVTLVQDVTHTYGRTYFGFGQISADYFYGLVTTARPEGPIGDPNYYAQVLLLGVAFGLVLAFGAPTRRARLTAFCATALSAAGVVLTYSRGAVVAFGVLVVLMVALRNVRLGHAALVAAILAVVIAAVPSYRARVTSLSSVGGANAQVGAADAPDRSVLQRGTEMRAALLVVEHHPVLGVGPGQFPLHYQRYASEAGGEVHDAVEYGPNKGATPERVTHDIFLGVAANLGLVGLAAFVAIIVTAGRGVWRARSSLGDGNELRLYATGCVLALAAYLTAGLFLELAYERYFWLLLALAAAVTRLAAQHKDGVMRAGGTW
jgi:putative inorganic carbon (hco3(-)) transporter